MAPIKSAPPITPPTTPPTTAPAILYQKIITVRRIVIIKRNRRKDTYTIRINKRMKRKEKIEGRRKKERKKKKEEERRKRKFSKK